MKGAPLLSMGRSTAVLRIIGSAHWSRWLDVAQILVGAAALVGLLRAVDPASSWLLLAFLIPAVRWVAVRSYRRRIHLWLGQLWESCHPAAERIPWQGTAVLVVLPTLVFFLANDAAMQSGDSWPVVPTAYQLLRHGSADLTPVLHLANWGNLNDAGLPYFVMRRAHGIYSGYPAGMVAFAVPVVAVNRLLGVDSLRPDVLRRLQKLTAASVAALALGLFFLAARELGNARTAWWLTALLACGSVFTTVCSEGLWQHTGVVFGMLAALFVEFRNENRPVPGASLFQGLACGMLLATRLSSALFVIPFGVWVLLRAPRRAVVLTACSCLAYLPWALFYSAHYGTIFGPSSGQLTVPTWGSHPGAGLVGLLFSPGRGLFVYQPWLLVGLTGWLVGVGNGQEEPSRGPVGWRWLCVAVVVCHVTLVALWGCWWGGYCWGSRLLTEVTPLAALLCLRPLAQWWSSSARGVVVVLALLAFLIHAPALYFEAYRWDGAVQVDRRPDRLWSWSHPPFLYPWQRNHVYHH